MACKAKQKALRSGLKQSAGLCICQRSNRPQPQGNEAQNGTRDQKAAKYFQYPQQAPQFPADVLLRPKPAAAFKAAAFAIHSRPSPCHMIFFRYAHSIAEEKSHETDE